MIFLLLCLTHFTQYDSNSIHVAAGGIILLLLMAVIFHCVCICVYVCVYVCVYICIHTHTMYICMYVCMYVCMCMCMGFPGGASGKDLPANAEDIGDTDSIPGSERSLGVRNGNPLQYSCLENSMDREAWRAVVHRVAENWTRLSTHTHTYTYTYRIFMQPSVDGRLGGFHVLTIVNSAAVSIGVHVSF